MVYTTATKWWFRGEYDDHDEDQDEDKKEDDMDEEDDDDGDDDNDDGVLRGWWTSGY